MLSRFWSVMGLGTSVEAGDGDGTGAHFSAVFTSSLEGTDEPQKIPFDRVLSSNPPEAFSTETHDFTCTVAGSYFFTFSVRPDRGKAAAVCLMKNDDRQVMLYAHKNKRDPGMATQSAILDLAEGDKAWLQLASGEEYGILSHPGVPLVTFTGILVKAS